MGWECLWRLSVALITEIKKQQAFGFESSMAVNKAIEWSFIEWRSRVEVNSLVYDLFACLHDKKMIFIGRFNDLIEMPLLSGHSDKYLHACVHRTDEASPSPNKDICVPSWLWIILTAAVTHVSSVVFHMRGASAKQWLRLMCVDVCMKGVRRAY